MTTPDPRTPDPRTPAPAPSVPLIDLTSWYDGDETARRALAAEVDLALREVGFLLVTGHRLGTSLPDRVREQVRPFFAQPAEVKQRYACRPGGRGWIPPGAEANAASDGVESPPDLKESWTFGAEDVPPEIAGTAEESWYRPNVWAAEVPELRSAGTEFAQACTALADDLMELFALALELPADFFTSRCAGNPWSVNLNWYPAVDQVGEAAEGQFRIGQHTDFGTLTILDRQPGSGGLQVRLLDGSWVDAPFVPGALTINTGDLLARWTGDRWRSTPHRVLPPPADEPTEELLSLVFFSEADLSSVVETLPTAQAGPHRYEPVTAGAFLRGRMDSLTVG